ncbi:uncharacterized protein LOC141722833 [Apium graveolens]|uniref:uncharacterized protein LOC141722833 n=1 Tax=Apium graveolens TaxID=4045 RepID=UPI003D7A687A
MDGLKRKAIETNNPIQKAYNMDLRAQLDSEIARAFYSGGFPFHYARNPYYNKSYTMASEFNLSSYVPPTYNALRTTLLQKKELMLRENGPMFLKAVKYEGEIKDKFHLATLMREVIMEAAGMIIEASFPYIFWTPCVVHTLNLALKNIVMPRIVSLIERCMMSAIGLQRFASVTIMVRRFKLQKRSLERLVLCEEWNKPSLHLVYDMWDDMIEKVKNIIYRHEKKELFKESPFYDVVYAILIARWTKSSSPIHCFAHSLNPRYYSYDWLNGAHNRLPPHQDIELSQERNKCIKRYFPDGEARKAVSIEYARFSGHIDIFGNADSIEDRGTMDPKMWWLVHGVSATNIQEIALKLLGQPCSSSCCERNWSTYSFIHSVRRNKILPTRAEDLVYVHTNLRLLSRKSDLYLKGETKLWDVGHDHFDPLDGAEDLEIASLSLDEPEMERMIYEDDDV